MHIVIAKVDEVLFEGEARSVTLPGADGALTVLSRHMPLITTLNPGTITVRFFDEVKPRQFSIRGGILEVNSAGATVMV